MNLSRISKSFTIGVLTLGLVAGCATTQKQNEAAAAPTPTPAPAPKAEAPMTAPAPTPSKIYTVEKGDNLWNISAQSDIYGDPYQWPLIYKANSDQIKDADLIFPGQRFTIDTGVSASAIDAAINHARNRGAWSVGATEESDLTYLGR